MSTSSTINETSPLLSSGKRDGQIRSYNHGSSEGLRDANHAQPGDSTPTTINSVTSSSQDLGHIEIMPPYSTLVPILTALWVPVFVASLDGTIVATLLNSISSSFNASEQAAWLGSSYLLSVCCFTPIYGRLADILGRKKCMLVALSFFTIGTLLCGMSTSMNMLIASRAIAGMGGGGLTTTSSVIMSDLVPLKNRGLLQGLTNIIFGLGSGLGGPIGGWMNDTLGWRKAFLLQIPFLGVAYVLAILFVNIPTPVHTMNQTTREKIRNIDFVGSLSLVVAVSSTLISLSLMSANDRTIDEPIVWGGLLLGALSSVLFFYAEKNIARQPVLPLGLVTQRTGGSVAFANLFLSITSFGMLYNFPLFFQTVKLESSSMAGLHLIPNSIGLSVGSVLAGVYMRQTGRFYNYNLVNSLLCFLSLVSLCFFDRDTPEWFTYLTIAPHGFGAAGVLTCTLIALINGVERKDVAVATSMSYLARTTGQILGVSCSGTLLQALLKRELNKRIVGPGSQEIISKIRHQSSIVSQLPDDLRVAAVQSYSYSLRWTFIALASVGFLTLVSNLWIEDLVLPDFETANKSKLAVGDDGDSARQEGRSGEGQEGGEL
ncbi:MFS general substrate transporter [Violaceomyces palustris]|uniref:MFS general substrate transporter n=1 Tax=Violaceomyces palustris TaxID=1673888 RepID=A0ACD0P8Q2_9BASI|nr:MFS general substrate transporter [Violaceomyces palustris]